MDGAPDVTLIAGVEKGALPSSFDRATAMVSFEQPILIVISTSGRVDRVSSPRDALRYLISNTWPNKSGTAFENAVQTCLRAMSGDFPSGTARSAFLAAAQRAHVLAEETDGTYRQGAVETSV
jgi:uncharacterized protein DUF982